MMRARWATLIIVGALGCAHPTELVLVVQSDLRVPDDIDEVEIATTGGVDGGVPSLHIALGANGAPPFPLTLGIRPAGDASEVVVEVTGRRAGSPVVGQRFRAPFVRGESRTLAMQLYAACARYQCQAAMTCAQPMGCRSEVVSADEMPPWSGQAPPLPAGPPPVMPPDGGPMVTPEMSDDFEAAISMPDMAKWTINVGIPDKDGVSTGKDAMKIVQSNGVLQITPFSGRGGKYFRGYRTAQVFDFHDAIASVEVPTVAQNGAQTVFSIDNGKDVAYVFRVRWNSVLKRNLLSFEDTLPNSVSDAETYKPIFHRFWRLRHDANAGELVWETSDSKDGPWSAKRSISVPTDTLDEVSIALYAGTTDVVGLPGVAQFDNFLLGHLQK